MKTDKSKQTSARFAKLEAIPRHVPITGAKALIARVYIARRMAAVIASGTAVATIAGIIGMQSIGGSSAGTVAPMEVAHITTPLDLAEESREESAPVIPPVSEAPSPEDVAAADEAADAGLRLYQKAVDDPVQDTEAVFNQSPLTGVPSEFAASVVKDSEATAPIHTEKDAIGSSTQIPEKEMVAKTAFSLPTAGIPTETDISTFLQGPASGPLAPVAGVEGAEDMSPTVALPQAAPLPTARPTPEIARGTKVEFHLVQGKGLKSGFWLGNKEDPKARRFFVIVRPQLESGDSVRWKFTNIADGTAAETDKLAIEVTEEAFVGLAKEEKQFGQVRNPVLGRGAVGDSDVKWRIEAVGDNMIAGWEEGAGK